MPIPTTTRHIHTCRYIGGFFLGGWVKRRRWYWRRLQCPSEDEREERQKMVFPCFFRRRHRKRAKESRDSFLSLVFWHKSHKKVDGRKVPPLFFLGSPSSLLSLCCLRSPSYLRAERSFLLLFCILCVAGLPKSGKGQTTFPKKRAQAVISETAKN